MEINLKATDIFKRNYTEYQKKTRFVVNQGGRGSSKTWSLAQLFLIILTTKKSALLTVCRKTLPSLKASAYRDFFAIIQEQNMYNPDRHNKTELTYTYNNNEIEFISLDQPQKVRGRKRQYLWMNETNEFTYEDFRQLNLRTDTQIYMDFNPSMEFHWIYDDILTRDDTTFIKSTYLDNPYLDKNIIKEIERLKSVDENYWRIYGLGERGIAEATIYKNWDYIDSLPEEYDERIYGLDFGFNNPTALIEVRIKDKDIYVEEKLYQSHITNSQLIEKLSDYVNQEDYIYPDQAEPQRIEEISQAGYNVKPSDKDVKKGIDTLRSRKIFITKSSINLLKEIKTYSWKQKDDKSLDEPIKDNDHLMDALRYAVHSHLNVDEPDITFI